MNYLAILNRIVKPLASRKVRVALATVVAAYAGEYGLGLSEEMVFTILGVGAAVILGIAHEDNGLNSSSNAPIVQALRNRAERAESEAGKLRLGGFDKDTVEALGEAWKQTDAPFDGNLATLQGAGNDVNATVEQLRKEG